MGVNEWWTVIPPSSRKASLRSQDEPLRGQQSRRDRTLSGGRRLGPYGITSNAIAPGFVDTGIVARSSNPELEDRVRALVNDSAPLRRAATVKDIACAALYLASDAAAYVTGEILDVNGGS